MDVKKILVITDNGNQYEKFKKLINTLEIRNTKFEFRRSKKSSIAKLYEKQILELNEIIVKTDYKNIINEFDLVISLHCKQIFPEILVNNIKCINIHPGYNPYNRGWYPQVFALAHENIIGATIHEIDAKLDHGPIIARESLEIEAWDTSISLYEKVLDLEIKLIEENLIKIIEGNYTTIVPEETGKVYTRKDFKDMCELDMDEILTFKEFYNKLRALSHGEYYNAFFFDKKNNKIFVKLEIKKEIDH